MLPSRSKDATVLTATRLLRISCKLCLILYNSVLSGLKRTNMLYWRVRVALLIKPPS